MVLQATFLAACVAAGAFVAWHCRALHSWLHNLRALALLPHPASEHWLWGNAQALTRPDFHRRVLQHATELGAIFSMRLIWFKVRYIQLKEPAWSCIWPLVKKLHILAGPALHAGAAVSRRLSLCATRAWWRSCCRATPRSTSLSRAEPLQRATSPSAWYVRAGEVPQAWQIGQA